MVDRDDVDLANYGLLPVESMTFDIRDTQCGREVHTHAHDHMGNLTARNTRLFYTVKRLGDPLIHVPGSASSRTACGYPVCGYDDVDVIEDRFVTCVRCVVVAMNGGLSAFLETLRLLAEEEP